MFDEVVRIGDRLAGLIDALDPDAVSAEQADRWWTALDRVERLAGAGKTLLARRVGATHRSGARPAGAGSAAAGAAAEALARRAGGTVGAARDQLDTSARLSDQPALAAALRRGQLSPAQAAAISPAAAANPSAAPRLIELAGRASLPELREQCARERAAADPDPQASNDRLHAARRLRRYTDPDGAWTLIAKGTPQAGAAVNAALDPIIDQIFRAARRAGRREPADAYAFDALIELAVRATGGHPAPGAAPPADGGNRAADSENTGDTTDTGADTGTDTGTDTGADTGADTGDTQMTLPGAGVPDGGAAPGDTSRPAATNTGASDTGAGTAAGPGSGVPGRWAPRYLALLRVDLEALHRGRVADDELCEITGIGPIPVTVARGLLGEAVLKLVITRGVDVAHVTHLGRGPTAAQKIALAWTSPGCIVEGCYRSRIQYDHREDWSRTRHTRLDELDPLCSRHHDLKTRHGWALVPGIGKRPMVPPDDSRHPRHHTRTRPSGCPAPPAAPSPPTTGTAAAAPTPATAAARLTSGRGPRAP